MSLLRATPTHLAAVSQLLQNAYYRYVDMGMEDLSNLLSNSPAALGEDQGRVWGFLGVQVEERPVTMPSDAPTRAHLRAVAFQHNHAPELELPKFLTLLARTQPAHPHAIQYLCYGAEPWLSQALAEAGFSQVEAVQFYQLDRLHRRALTLPPPPSDLSFSTLQHEQLDTLAALDAISFDPLWHFGRRDLFELLMRGRIQLAWWRGNLAGYSAVCANNRSEGQLARLAVHPDYQGRGIGRAIMSEAIQYAARDFSILVLNTQINNTRSQALYRSLGFRPIGISLAVLGLTVT